MWEEWVSEMRDPPTKYSKSEIWHLLVEWDILKRKMCYLELDERIFLMKPTQNINHSHTILFRFSSWSGMSWAWYKKNIVV